MAAMWARFVDTSKIYSGVVEEARKFGYTGGCPIAGRVEFMPSKATLF